MSSRTHADFQKILSQLAGQDQAARSKIIDQYDHIRTAQGRGTAWDWLESERPASRLHQILPRLKDLSARNTVESALNQNNFDLIEKLEGRLTEKMIDDAADWAGITEEQIIEQASDLKQRRSLRKKAKQATGLLNMALMTTGRLYPYASPFEVELRNQQKQRLKTWAQETFAVKGSTEVPLYEIIKNSGDRRMAELYTLSKGLNDYAKAAGLTWAFWTLTAPPRMHPNPIKGQNSWDGTTPAEAHDWIFQNWHRAEARMRKDGIVTSGVRTVEPHQDGCPHWHLMLFGTKTELRAIEEIIRDSCPEWAHDLDEDGEEQNKGAEVEYEDPSKGGSASTYLFKYIQKTISHTEEIEDEKLAAIDAWRSTWGIHSFDFFGMPPQNLWRELRKTKEAPADSLLAGLWRAAKRGDAHAFIGLAGGLNCKKSERPASVKIEDDGDKKIVIFTNHEDGKITKDERDKWAILNKDELDELHLQQRQPHEENETVEVIVNFPRTPNPHPNMDEIEEEFELDDAVFFPQLWMKRAFSPDPARPKTS